MTTYEIIVEGANKTFDHVFDGEPQINLTFEDNGVVYRVITRAHDEDDTLPPRLHAQIV
jgi:hypothetical protein